MANITISRIQNRRGLFSDLQGVDLASGELGWTIDGQRLFIGNGELAEGAPFTGNTEIITEHGPATDLIKYQYLDRQPDPSTGSFIPSVNVGWQATRSLQERLDDRLNIKAFGVLGNGDFSTAGMQNNTLNMYRAMYEAYLRAPITPYQGADTDYLGMWKPIYFPAGVYVINAPLPLLRKASLIGDGSGRTVIILSSTVNSNFVAATATYNGTTFTNYPPDSELLSSFDFTAVTQGLGYPCQDITVSGITFVNLATSTCGLYVNGSVKVTADDCKFSKTQNGVVVGNSIAVQVRSGYFDSTVTGDAFADSSPSGHGNGCLFSYLSQATLASNDSSVFIANVPNTVGPATTIISTTNVVNVSNATNVTFNECQFISGVSGNTNSVTTTPTPTTTTPAPTTTTPAPTTTVPPVWVTTSLPSPAYSGPITPFQFQAMNPSGDPAGTITYAVDPSSTLPAGLTLSSSGLLTGTVGHGTFNFSIDATCFGTTAQAFTWTVAKSSPPVWNTAQTLPNGMAGTSYSVQLSATDPQGATVTYTVDSGTPAPLPTGLTLGGTGLLSGTIDPSVFAGVYYFTLDASSIYGTAVQQFNITISAAVTTTPAPTTTVAPTTTPPPTTTPITFASNDYTFNTTWGSSATTTIPLTNVQNLPVTWTTGTGSNDLTYTIVSSDNTSVTVVPNWSYLSTFYTTPAQQASGGNTQGWGDPINATTGPYSIQTALTVYW